MVNKNQEKDEFTEIHERTELLADRRDLLDVLDDFGDSLNSQQENEIDVGDLKPRDEEPS